MSNESEPAVDPDLIGERRHLLSLAFRMLGTVAEAEDAVQETYIRWYRMDQGARDEIVVPRAWLTRVASRICLDMLGTARARRERYVGPWLPEPVPASAFAQTVADPIDQVTLDDSVSTALLVVLEAMTPAERVAFVLHDVFAMPFPEIAQIVGRTPAACRQRKRAGVEVLEQETSDGLGFALWDEGRITGVVTLEVLDGRITNVRMVLNPEKLILWN